MTPDRSPYTSARRHDSRIVFESGGALYELDDVGSRVYRLIDGRRSLGDIAARLAADFGEEREAVEDDVVELVEQLRSLGAVL